MYERQMKKIAESWKASSLFLEWLEESQLPHDHVPWLEETEARLKKATGRSIVNAQNEYLSAQDWFNHLEQKAFPVTDYIRPLEDIDYTPLPDLFHEYFGHIPVMFTSVSQIQYKTALLYNSTTDKKKKLDIARITRYSMEYGIVREENTMKAFWAGILSSPGDFDRFCHDSFVLVDANISEIINTPRSPHNIHKKLFVFDSIKHMSSVLDEYERQYLLV